MGGHAGLGALGASHQSEHVAIPPSGRGTLSVLWICGKLPAFFFIQWVCLCRSAPLLVQCADAARMRCAFTRCISDHLRLLLSATWFSRHKGAIDTMRRQIEEIEEGACEPKHGDGGALLRNLVLKHSTNGTGGLDNRKTFSDQEVVTQVKG